MLAGKINGKPKIVLLSQYRAKKRKINTKEMGSWENKLRK